MMTRSPHPASAPYRAFPRLPRWPASAQAAPLERPAPRSLLGWATLAAAVLAALYLAGCSGGRAAPSAPGAVDVGVLTLNAKPLALRTELTGRAVAAASAEIRPQVTALLRERLFKEGSLVKAGQPLYQLDAASAQATLRSAQASVARAQATLAAAELKAKRLHALVAADAGTQQDLEDAQAALLQAKADLQTALATQTNAQIDLDHTLIKAPLSGRVDTSSVAPGALVTANQTAALTTVQQLDPIWVDLPQSSVDLLKLRRQLDSGTLKSGVTEVRLTLEDGSAYPLPGQLQVRGVAVSTTTGTVTLRAQVPNPDGLLLPGMVLRATLSQAQDPAALLVPQAGISRSPRGDATALVVAPDGTVQQRAVTVDPVVVDGQWRVTQGLAAGDRVIVEGAGKVRPGQLVHAVPAGAAAAASLPGSGAASAPQAAASR
jgi:membrane fusion protein (multidrug efflux system)